MTADLFTHFLLKSFLFEIIKDSLAMVFIFYPLRHQLTANL